MKKYQSWWKQNLKLEYQMQQNIYLLFILLQFGLFLNFDEYFIFD